MILVPQRLALLLLSLVLFERAHGRELRVGSEKASVYARPTANAEVFGQLPKGKRVVVADEEGDFFRIRSKTGRDLWVRKVELSEIESPASYDVASDIDEGNRHLSNFKRIRLDMGVAGGRARNEAFSESAFGVEYFMMERLSLRSAVFYRRAPMLNDSFGFDLSVRGNGGIPLGPLGLRGILGAGYRFATQDVGAPFAEVGGFAALRGFDIGLMAKYLLRGLGDAKRENVVIYSVVFSGTTGLF